jgi:hypothetical protein
VGDRVRVTAVAETRALQSGDAETRFVRPYLGQCGLVVQDDGDSTPFKVSFAGRPPCYFREEELEIAELEAEQMEFRAAVPFSQSEAGLNLHRHELRLDSRASNTCDIDGPGCRRRGTAYRCTLGCDFDA